MGGTKPVVLGIVLLCALVVLSSCAVVELQGESTSAVPNLGLLQMDPYVGPAVGAPVSREGEEAYVQVDLWLDASQDMGGVNPNLETVYPHMSKRYREGGFHYRYQNQVGWYETVLKNMLDAASGSRVRVLRYGNERLPDSYLKGQGLAEVDAAPETLRSLRRDLLTYAINPLPSVFMEMSAEDMTDSFYSLGSPKLNQMARFLGNEAMELENPQGMADNAYALVLENQIRAIALGEGAQMGLLPRQSKEENDYPLLYALDNIATDRISVITFDPATLRSLTGTDTAGKPVAYVEQLLRQRGLFDQGLAVGLYLFQLDYMGEMTTIGAADLAEPLIWGKLIFNTNKQSIDYVAPMPRVAMALVIGPEAPMRQYMDRLNAKLGSDAGLRGLRGPLEGELTYARQGQTITQQPFSFFYQHTVISRPNAGFYTQQTQGAEVAVLEGTGQVAAQNGLQMAVLRPGEKGRQEDRTLSLSFPLQKDDNGAKLDLSQLQGLQAEVMGTLLLTETLENTPENRREAKAGEQIVPLRDTIYVYARQQDPFAQAPEENPFVLEGLSISEDGARLVCTLGVEGGKLREGYYRLRVQAGLTSEEVSWLPVDWIDGPGSLNVTISGDDIVRWEGFSAVISQMEAKRSNITTRVTHAWGPHSTRTYYGSPVPDCPPVERAMGLAELAAQLRAAATAPETALLNYVFDVFVDNRDAAQAVSVQ